MKDRFENRVVDEAETALSFQGKLMAAEIDKRILENVIQQAVQTGLPYCSGIDLAGEDLELTGVAFFKCTASGFERVNPEDVFITREGSGNEG